MASGHGGNLRRLAREAGLPVGEILDFSANINPLGPPEWLGEEINRQIKAVAHYPDPDSTALVGALARRYAVPPEEVVVGNGSSDLLYVLPRAFRVSRVVVPVPSYVDTACSTRRTVLT
jgi:histidinol-phosphate/aromatic aminotransferase/cobyric acid decarboxylase-like protein